MSFNWNIKTSNLLNISIKSKLILNKYCYQNLLLVLWWNLVLDTIQSIQDSLYPFWQAKFSVSHILVRHTYLANLPPLVPFFLKYFYSLRIGSIERLCPEFNLNQSSMFPILMWISGIFWKKGGFHLNICVNRIAFQNLNPQYGRRFSMRCLFRERCLEN